MYESGFSLFIVVSPEDLWGNGDWWIPRAHWPSCPAHLVNSKVMIDSISENIVGSYRTIPKVYL